MKVIAAIQARMGSKRLKRKALIPIEGRTAIEWIARRLKAAKGIDQVVLSTSVNPENDVLEELAKQIRLPVFRGSETDLIQRLLSTLQHFKADALVRVTADCPLVDPEVVDRMVAAYKKNPKSQDFLTNIYPPSYPDGLDLDVLPKATLERLDREVQDALHREWFIPYILERPRQFRITNVAASDNFMACRWTLDYPEDLKFIRAIFKRLGRSRKVFQMDDILQLLKDQPELAAINANRVDKTVKQGIRSHAYHALKKKSRTKGKSS